MQRGFVATVSSQWPTATHGSMADFCGPVQAKCEQGVARRDRNVLRAINCVGNWHRRDLRTQITLAGGGKVLIPKTSGVIVLTSGQIVQPVAAQLLGPLSNSLQIPRVFTA
jgi:hypothetical protein